MEIAIWCGILILIGLAIFQPFFFDKMLEKLHIPFIIHVDNVHGLDETRPYKYPISARHPWRLERNRLRLNVDVNIDGIINKWHGFY